jgi:hypothetical protein
MLFTCSLQHDVLCIATSTPLASSTLATLLYSGAERSFTVTDLPPYTVFAFYVKAFNGAGFTQSSPLTNATTEQACISHHFLLLSFFFFFSCSIRLLSLSFHCSIPVMFSRLSRSSPSSLALSPVPEGISTLTARLSITSITLSWTKPLTINGVFVRYELRDNTTLLYSGTNEAFNVSTLLPYTVYAFQLSVVNGAGKSNGEWTSFRTLEDGIVHEYSTPLSSFFFSLLLSLSSLASPMLIAFNCEINLVFSPLSYVEV